MALFEKIRFWLCKALMPENVLVLPPNFYQSAKQKNNYISVCVCFRDNKSYVSVFEDNSVYTAHEITGFAAMRRMGKIKVDGMDYHEIEKKGMH